MKKRSDFLGYEFDWFAVDSDGFVALMSSAGFGSIPDAVFKRFDRLQRIEEFLCNLISHGDLLLSQQFLSAAGVFTYDWKSRNGPYRRIATPLQPRCLDELGFPADLRDDLVTIPERFCASTELRPEAFLPCSSLVD